jgi:hypothetical protein
MQGNLYSRGRLGTLDLLVVASINQLLLIFANVYSFTKSYLKKKLTVLSFPLQPNTPWFR